MQALRFGRDPFGYLRACADEYGDLFTLRLPGEDAVLVASDPQVVRQFFALRSPAPRRSLNLPANVGEHSLVFLDGSPHQRERRLLMPHLHGERLRGHAATMQGAAAQEIGRWRAGDVVDVRRALRSITLDVILRCVFAARDPAVAERVRGPLLGWLDGTFTPLVFLAGIVFGAERVRGALDDLTRRSLARPAGARSRLPWRRWADDKARVLTHLRDDIARCRREGAGGRHDVLAMLVEARDPEGRSMSDDQVADELVTLLVAGHETTANTAAWALYRILTHPDAHARVRAELAQVFGDGPVDVARVGELRWLDACLKESMRLTPILPAVTRPLHAPLELRGRTIPAGTALWAAVCLTHQRADLWDQPGRYLPARFLGAAPPASHYFPFGGGHRTCLGMAFAMLEMRIVLAELFQRTRLRLSPATAVRVGVRAATVAPVGTLELVVDEIRTAASPRAA